MMKYPYPLLKLNNKIYLKIKMNKIIIYLITFQLLTDLTTVKNTLNKIHKLYHIPNSNMVVNHQLIIITNVILKDQ